MAGTTGLEPAASAVTVEIKRCRRTSLGAREYRTTILIVPLTSPDFIKHHLKRRLLSVLLRNANHRSSLKVGTHLIATSKTSPNAWMTSVWPTIRKLYL